MNALVVDADLRSIRAIGPWVAENLATAFPAGLDAATAPRMELGLQELAVNIVEHGYAGRRGTIELHFAADERTAVIDIIDGARAVDLADLWSGSVRVAERDNVDLEAQVRGYGLSLIRELTSEFAVRNDGRTNRWRVVFPVALQQAQ